MSEIHNEPWPTEIKVNRAEKFLTVSFDTGESFQAAGRISSGREPIG